MTPQIRHLVGLTAAALAVTSTLAVTAEPASAAGHKRPTNFSLKANGWGTSIRGGDIPGNSDSVLGMVRTGCTSNAGILRKNNVAGIDVPGLGTVGVVESKAWTTKRNGTVAVNSVQNVADIVLGGVEVVPGTGSLGSITIKGVKSRARAWHDASGFHSSSSTEIAKIVATPPAPLPAFELPIPTPDQPITTLPGVGTLELGSEKTWEKGTWSAAKSDVIYLYSELSDSRVKVAHSMARIDGGVTNGVFNGQANGLNAKALTDIVKVGKVASNVLPCTGTDGTVKKMTAAGLNLPGVLTTGVVNTSVFGKSRPKQSTSWTRSSLAGLNLGGGALVLNGVVAKAKAVRLKSGKVIRSTDGTTIGSATVNGQSFAIPDLDGLEIPGVASIETNVVGRVKGGVKVTALRITLLDGSGAVINVGNARAAIHD